MEGKPARRVVTTNGRDDGCLNFVYNPFVERGRQCVRAGVLKNLRRSVGGTGKETVFLYRMFFFFSYKIFTLSVRK